MTVETSGEDGPLADEWFGRNIKAVREEKGMSQTAVARLMRERGFTSFEQQTLSKVEAGGKGKGRGITIGEALALSQIVGVTIEALAGPPRITRLRADLRRATLDVREGRQHAYVMQQKAEAAIAGLSSLVAEARSSDIAASIADELADAEAALKEEGRGIWASGRASQTETRG